MRTHRFGRKIKLPATIAIKHQLRKLMFEDAVKPAECVSALRGARPTHRKDDTGYQGRTMREPPFSSSELPILTSPK